MEIGGAVPIKEYCGVIENITSVKVNKKRKECKNILLIFYWFNDCFSDNG